MKMLSTVTRRPRLITATIFGALALSFGVVSLAADSNDPPQEVVEFGDLNMQTLQGAETLYGRIEGAAHDVCEESYNYEDDVWTHEFLTACVHQAIANAVNKVGARQLYAVYNAKNHRSR